MSGDFKATPLCAIAFFLHFLKGFSKEIDHLSLVDFLHSRTFQAKFGIWSLLLPAQRVLRASERGLRKGSNRKIVSQVEKIFQNNELLYLEECKRLLLF